MYPDSHCEWRRICTQGPANEEPVCLSKGSSSIGWSITVKKKKKKFCDCLWNGFQCGLTMSSHTKVAVLQIQTSSENHPALKKKKKICVCVCELVSRMWVPTGSPSLGGDVAHSCPKLAHSFFSSCVYFCLYCPFNCISFHKFSRQLSAFSSCSSSLNSALLVLSTLYLFMKVPLSPDIILCGWLGLKHQLTELPECGL